MKGNRQDLAKFKICIILFPTRIPNKTQAKIIKCIGMFTETLLSINGELLINYSRLILCINFRQLSIYLHVILS